MLSPSPIARRLATASRNGRDQRGFTLIETLVAILTGIVVTMALFAILEVSLHQTARAGDVVQSSQLGRATMTRMVDELRSACIASEFAPVQPTSTNTELVFRNSYSEKAVPTSATEHEIVWYEKAGSKTNEKAGALTDYAFPSNGGTWPTFTYSKTESPVGGTLIGEDIAQQENAKKEAVPIFQYYAYSTTAGSVKTGVPVGTLTPIPLAAKEALGATKAAEVASVLISIRAGATDGLYKTKGGVADFSNQVTLAFSAPNPEATIEDGPCQ